MEFKVTPEYVSNAATNCVTTADQIQTQLGVLRNYVVSLESTYHGVAAATFQSLMTNYDVFSKMLDNALRDIGSGLSGNYVNYTATEEANIAQLVAINGDIPGANL